MSGRMIVELYCVTTGEVIASVAAPNGSTVALTGAIDLPAGNHEICIRMYLESYDGYGDWKDAELQVVIGQTVTERGCIVSGGSA